MTHDQTASHSTDRAADRSSTSALLRYTAFTHRTDGGNPAGLVLDASTYDERAMQALAAEVGYSQTAFLTGTPYADQPMRVRYFSPLVEVAFCGHATIAAAVALGERHGPGTLHLETNAGPIAVDVTAREDGLMAEITSVETSSRPATRRQVGATLEALGWDWSRLGGLVPHVAFAGNHHLVLPVRDRATLAALDYDFEVLRALTAAEGWLTVDLVHVDGDDFHVRNPFPIGGIVEDPASGSAAAALGGYLLATGAITSPRTFVVHQGHDMGRPSRLFVSVAPPNLRVRVAGGAVALPHPVADEG